MIVSRQALLETKFSTSVCAPVYSRHDGLATQVEVGVDHGLKADSSIHCDELVSLPKSMLTRYVGSLSEAGISELRTALMAALDLAETTSCTFGMCVDNDAYEASLILGKVYRILRDTRAAKDDLVRIVDETGEDYLYHRDHFVFGDFPSGVARRN